MSNNNSNGKFKKFFSEKLAGKGYYIALILCAVAIGVSGYLYYHNTHDPSLEEPDPTVDVLNPNSSSSSTPPTEKPTEPTKKPWRTGKPVSGEVVMDYAMDCLCFNPTTRDWRTHNGMDFAADAGTAVCAAADGTVYTVYSDETMGTTIVIRHNDGYVTTYSSLSQDVVVAVGQEVTLGQTIGYVGTSALVELTLGDHVHFAVTCGGNPIDPEDFFAMNEE